MRAPETAGSGTAKLILSFDDWKAGRVAAAETTLEVVKGESRVLRPISTRLQRKLRIAPTPATVTLASLAEAAVGTLAYSGDGRHLAAATTKGVIKVWNAADGQEFAAFKVEEGTLHELAFHGQTVLSSHMRDERTKSVQGDKRFHHKTSGEVRLWNVATRKPAGVLKHEPSRGMLSMTICPKGNLLATSEIWSEDAGQTSKRQVSLWDLKTRKVLQTFPINGNAFMAFSPDGKMLAVASKKIQLWDVSSGRELGEFPGPSKEGPLSQISLAFAPDGKTLACGDERGRVHLWDVNSKKLRSTLTVGERTYHIPKLAFAPDGKTLAVSILDVSRLLQLDQSEIMIWDLATLQKRETLVTPPGIVITLAFSPDGRTLASGGMSWVHLWDLTGPAGTGRENK